MKLLHQSSPTLWSVCLAVALSGCAGISHKPQSGVAPAIDETRHIAVFFDGTANDEGSDTNVKKLHSLVTLQGRADIATLYIEGVGTGPDLSGAAAGSGINRRVQIAYEFIRNHYRHKAPGTKDGAVDDKRDKIYIFGFSRGAFSARILTSMLYNAGIPVVQDATKCRLTSAEFAEVVHEAVAPQSAHVDRIEEPTRRQRTQEELSGFNTDPVKLSAANDCFSVPSPPVDVEVLGLWDTVEALGFPNWASRVAHKLSIHRHTENIDVPNVRYGDTLCNVRHAFHAVSIDDNRAWIFTPLLLTRRHLFDACSADKGTHKPPMLDGDRIIMNRLQEVWFAGAHSDVGGGYGESALSGVSLNWMIKALDSVAGRVDMGILPAGARVREDPLGSSHNPSTGFFDLTYHAIHRDMYRYMQHDDERGRPRDEFKGRLCVHGSVFDRRSRVPRQPFENPQLDLKLSDLQLSQEAQLSKTRIDPTLRWTWHVQQAQGPLVDPKSLTVDRYPSCQNMTSLERTAP